jgi:hypothetical protein
MFSSVLQPKGQVASKMIPLLAKRSLVLRRLCRANQAKKYTFFGAKEFQILELPKQVTPPQFIAW